MNNRCLLPAKVTFSNSSLLKSLSALSRPIPSHVRYARTRASTSPFQNEMNAEIKKIKAKFGQDKIGTVVKNPFEKGCVTIGYEKARKEAEKARREAEQERRRFQAEEELRQYEAEQREKKAREDRMAEQERTGTSGQAPPDFEPETTERKTIFQDPPDKGNIDDGGTAYRLMQEEYLRQNPDWDGNEDEVRRKAEEEIDWSVRDEDKEKFEEWKGNGNPDYIKALKDTIKEGFRNSRGPTKEFQGLVQNVNKRTPEIYAKYHNEEGRVDFIRLIAECRREMEAEEKAKYLPRGTSKESKRLNDIRESAKAAELRQLPQNS